MEIFGKVLASMISVSIAIIIGFYLNGRFRSISKRLDLIDEKLSAINKELEEHKLDVAKNYVSKEDHEKDLNSLKEIMKDGFNSINDSINKIDKKLDRFEDSVKKELANKEDKKR